MVLEPKKKKCNGKEELYSSKEAKEQTMKKQDECQESVCLFLLVPSYRIHRSQPRGGGDTFQEILVTNRSENPPTRSKENTLLTTLR